jgi:transposase
MLGDILLENYKQGIPAFRAACFLPWSNGPTEGHVNRLKFLKRQMFGRARLDLLCVKVLQAM